MSILDDFVPEALRDSSVFISVTDYGITFSRDSVAMLGYPAFVRVYFDKKGKRMAVVPCESSEGARRFVKDGDLSGSGFVRWNDKRLLSQVYSLGALEPGGKGVRAMGEYVEEENLIVYDLKDTVPLRIRAGRENG